MLEFIFEDELDMSIKKLQNRLKGTSNSFTKRFMVLREAIAFVEKKKSQGISGGNMVTITQCWRDN